jgi:Bacterial HORMA domain family 1
MSSSSFTLSESVTFTVTHARHMASKIATDLRRAQRFYGAPSDADIASYESEVVALVKAGYLKSVSYGYRRDGKWIVPSLHYNAVDMYGLTGADDDPGGILPGADTTGAMFYSFLTYTSSWHMLSEAERAKFQGGLPFERSTAMAPGMDGYLQQDRTYSAGGKALTRSTLRSF